MFNEVISAFLFLFILSNFLCTNATASYSFFRQDVVDDDNDLLELFKENKQVGHQSCSTYCDSCTASICFLSKLSQIRAKIIVSTTLDWSTDVNTNRIDIFTPLCEEYAGSQKKLMDRSR